MLPPGEVPEGKLPEQAEIVCGVDQRVSLEDWVDLQIEGDAIRAVREQSLKPQILKPPNPEPQNAKS